MPGVVDYDPPGRLHPVDARHQHVHDHHVLLLAAAPRGRHPPRPPASPTTREPAQGLDEHPQATAHHRMVVDDHDRDGRFLARLGMRPWSTRTGLRLGKLSSWVRPGDLPAGGGTPADPGETAVPRHDRRVGRREGAPVPEELLMSAPVPSLSTVNKCRPRAGRSARRPGHRQRLLTDTRTAGSARRSAILLLGGRARRGHPGRGGGGRSAAAAAAPSGSTPPPGSSPRSRPCRRSSSTSRPW